MTEIPMKYFWMGHDVDKMSREDAIAALKTCGRLLQEAHAATTSAWRFNAEILNFRRVSE